MRFDATGKISLDHIYTQPDPRAYFNALRGLDYRIPQLAKPHFRTILDGYRAARSAPVRTVLDIGCSYGVNPALLRCDATMEELYTRYGDSAAAAIPRSAMLVRDQAFVRSRGATEGPRFVGLDASLPALRYALTAGFIDDAVHADLEARDPTEREREQLAGTDLVISTGCVGYVSDRTISRVVDAAGERRPWMAHFVLRMFPFDAVEECLGRLGYETMLLDGVFRQRRFASPEEQALVLDTLASVGVDPQGLEATGWLYAQLFVSWPRGANSRAGVADVAAQLTSALSSNQRVDASTTDTSTTDASTSGQPPDDREPSRTPMTTNSSAELSTRTFGNEDLLPRVPLPDLDATCDRFLEWCAPLLTAEQLAATAAEVEVFRRPGGPGRALHAELEAYDASDVVESWLDTFWPARYLGRRDRIALNANFFFLFQDPDPAQSQVERAAGLVASAVNYKLRLDEELVPPVVQRGRPLSMAQNTFLFSTTRIPGAEQDTVRTPYSEQAPGPSPARHILVFSQGNLFRMDVVGPDGQPYSLDDLNAGLRTVLKAGDTQAAPGTSVGHLTTKARAEWAASREALLACHPDNAAALDEVETALFCVCLEDLAPGDDLEACDQLLYGNSGNRWFDKAVSLVVFADGAAGINVEHCGLDGTTVLSFVDTLLGCSPDEQSVASGARPQGLPPVEPVEFVLDDALRADVLAAAESFAAYGAATATSVVSFEDFGADRAKQLRVSPDAFVQLAYQLAHQRAKGMIGATYESIATRQYRAGRTEAMRVVTPEISRFVAAMDDPGAALADRLAAFRAAADKHVARAKQCQSGQAPEQHLWELQLLQKRLRQQGRDTELGVGEPLGLYDTPGWLVMRDDYLSTSSAPSVNIKYFGFGSTSPTCIGVAYVLLPDRFNLYLSTPQTVADQMYGFADRLRDAVAELQELLATEGAG